jgi:hypothetical protein
MKIKFNKNKYLLFVFASWLVTKLKWSFEISRLAFFRTNKQAEIRFVINKKQALPLNVWKFENNKFTFIDYNFESDLFVLHQLPELNKN